MIRKTTSSSMNIFVISAVLLFGSNFKGVAAGRLRTVAAALFPRFSCLLFSRSLFRFDLSNFEVYDEFLRPDSTFTLAQAGVYIGPDAIKEYIQFSFGEYSPFIVQTTLLERSIQFSHYDKRRRECVFVNHYDVEYVFDPANTGTDTTWNMLSMAKIAYSIDEQYVSHSYVYYPPDAVSTLFDNFLDSSHTREYVCHIHSNLCGSILEASGGGDEPSDQAACLERLKVLPTTTEGLRLDTDSQGCRALHAVLAESSPEIHCPHLSFTHMPDLNGSIKCQESSGVDPLDLFSAREIAAFHEYCETKGLAGTCHNYSTKNNES